MWGGVLLFLWAFNLVGPSLIEKEDEAIVLKVVMTLFFMGFSIWLAIKGNEMTAKNYLEQGWMFVEPESEITKLAKMRWGISV